LDYPASGAPINGAPAGLSNVTVIAAGDTHSLALKSDGTVVGWNGALVPAGLSNVTAIAAGRNFSLLITPTPPSPMLAAAQEAGQFSLMAPISVSGFILESTDDLSQPFEPEGSGPTVITFGD